MIKHVVWDWNGTLLNDVDVCVETINSLLVDRGLPSIERDTYRARFGFPVRNFYLELGFDFASEDFDAVSTTFIERYRARNHRLDLQVGVHNTLTQLTQRGMSQHVVSAMEARMLHDMLTVHAIAPHVQHVRGLDHLNATSKVALGVDLVTTLGCAPHEILFVGDTLHDHETAVAMGCHCVLFAGGHQHHDRLSQAGVAIIADLHEIHEVIDSHCARAQHG